MEAALSGLAIAVAAVAFIYLLVAIVRPERF